MSGTNRYCIVLKRKKSEGLSAAAALSKVDGFQIYMKKCCDVGKVEAHFERSVTLDKSLQRAWNYATTLELSQAPWGYSPEEIGHVVADCTMRGKYVADAQFPQDERKRSYNVKGKTKFRATDTNSNRLAAVGKTELDGEGLCQLMGADGPLGNDETPQLPGLGDSEMAAFNVLAFENSAEAGSVKKKKKVAAIKDESTTVANSETPASTALMRMTAYPAVVISSVR